MCIQVTDRWRRDIINICLPLIGRLEEQIFGWLSDMGSVLVEIFDNITRVVRDVSDNEEANVLKANIIDVYKSIV